MMMQRTFTISTFPTTFPVNSPSETGGTSQDYNKLTVAEIKELLDAKGISYEGVTLKADLIKLLEGA